MVMREILVMSKKHEQTFEKTEENYSTLLERYETMTEHEHQREVFSWAKQVGQWGFAVADAWLNTHPESLKRPPISKLAEELGLEREPNDVFEWLHAIPNGGSRGGNRAQRQREGSRMKAEGVRPGIADIHLPRALQGFSGLYIELKKIHPKQYASPEQKAFAEYCGQNGFRWELCRGYLEAIRVLREYVNGSRQGSNKGLEAARKYLR